MTNPANPASLTSRIVAACNVPRGLAMGEIIKATGGHPPSVNALVPALIRRGDLHRVGTRMVTRYFASVEEAEAYALVFPQERAAALALKIQRSQANRDAKRAAQQAARPSKPKAPAKPKKPRQQVAKTPRCAKPKQGRAITIGNKAAGSTQIERNASVTWPAHVQVQRAPVCRDTRFTFNPPPDWQGEFTREWRERRSAA